MWTAPSHEVRFQRLGTASRHIRAASRAHSSTLESMRNAMASTQRTRRFGH